MCGRYVSPDQTGIERVCFHDRRSGDSFVRRFNVSPTRIIPVLHHPVGNRMHAAKENDAGLIRAVIGDR